MSSPFLFFHIGYASNHSPRKGIRSMNKLEKVVYRAEATSSGGRDGRSVSSDNKLEVNLAVPKEMGGNGDGTNPEQLFAAGYSACFLGAMKFVAGKEKIAIPPETKITGKVGI